MRPSAINATINGKAYEYACLLALLELVAPVRPIKVVENSSLVIAKGRYVGALTEAERIVMLASATAGMRTILSMEPRIISGGSDVVMISLQPDSVAAAGDIRDVLIRSEHGDWEIGVSVKHNHEALKHSRLSAKLDFGARWYGIPSSAAYFSEIAPVFSRLVALQSSRAAWRELPNKVSSVYAPLLSAFVRELTRAYSSQAEQVTAGLIAYLLGSNGKDYYKLIHHDSHTTRVIPYNLQGTLNQPDVITDPDIVIPNGLLPTRIVDLAPKSQSDNTVILTMDHEWSIAFRIHSASTLVEPSLKFDIQLVGQPAALFFIDASW